MVDGVNSNMSFGESPKREGVSSAKNTTDNEASIFSSYDDNKDGKVSYKDDASARSYIDAGKSDMVRFDSNYNEDARITSALNKLDNVWKDAVGDISIEYNREGTQEEIDDKAALDMYKESMKREKAIQTQLNEIREEIENAKREIDAEKAQAAEEVPEEEPAVEEDAQQEEPAPKTTKKSTKKTSGKKKTSAKKTTKQKTTNVTSKRSREYVDIIAKQDATAGYEPRIMDYKRANPQPTPTAMRIMSAQNNKKR